MDPKDDAQRAAKDQADVFFPSLGDNDAELDDNQAADDAQAGDETLTLADLQREIEGLKAFREHDKELIQTLRQDKDRLLTGILQTRDAALPPVTPQSAPNYDHQLDQLFDDVPDRDADPDAFKRWERKAKQLVKQAQAPAIPNPAAAPEAQTVAQLTQIWNDFVDDPNNEDLKQNEKLAYAVAVDENKKLRARGIDPVKALFTDPETILTRIAQETRKEIAKIRGDKPADSKPPANRTAGVTGGSKPAGTTSSKPAPPATSFVDELKNAQRKSGFF